MSLKGHFGDLKVGLGSGEVLIEYSAAGQAWELEFVHKLGVLARLQSPRWGGGHKLYPWALLASRPSIMSEIVLQTRATTKTKMQV